MQVVLSAINSKYIHTGLGLRYVGEYAKAQGDEVTLIEETINTPILAVLEKIMAVPAQVYGFSVHIWNKPFVFKLIRMLRKLRPQAAIVIGGPEVAFDAERIFTELPQADYIVQGEGELVFSELLEYLAGGGSVPQHIAYREGEQVNLNGGITVIDDMSLLPFPYPDLEKMLAEHKIVYYECTRGCPFNCAYCLSGISRSVRKRPLELVLRDLDRFIAAGVPLVKFVDRTYNLDEKYFLPMMEHLAQADTNATFHFEIKADILSEQVMDFLATVPKGRFQLEIGIQSTHQPTLKAINRQDNWEKLAANVKRLLSFGNMHIHVDLIAGLPYEDLPTFAKSFDDVYGLGADMLQLGFLKVLKGSKMYQNAKEYGIVYTDTAPYEVLYTKWISYADVLTLKAVEEMVELYYNSRQYVQSLTYLREFFDTPYAMFAYFADYYEKNGLFAVKHSRMTRYQHFYDAAKLRIMQGQKASDSADFSGTQAESGCEKTKDMQMEAQLELFTELLIFDLYERENLKTRPPFAPDLQPYKNVIREMAVVYAMPKTAHFELLSERTLQKAGISVDLPERNLKKQMAQSNPKVQISETQNQNSFRNRRIWTAFDYEKRSRLDYGAAVYLLAFADTAGDKKQ